MYKVLILMLLLFLSGVAGCIIPMNDDYDRAIVDGTSVYSVSGNFIDRSGKPIVGLTVVLKGNTTVSALTDSNGGYRFENVSPGSYTVTPGDRGHGSKNIVVSNGDVVVGTNKDGHGGNVNGDYTCSGCHKS